MAFPSRVNEIEAYLKLNEQQAESKSTPGFAGAASATARTVLFAVGAALTKFLFGNMTRQRR
jgi:hypothetical protein